MYESANGKAKALAEKMGSLKIGAREKKSVRSIYREREKTL